MRFHPYTRKDNTSQRQSSMSDARYFKQYILYEYEYVAKCNLTTNSYDIVAVICYLLTYLVCLEESDHQLVYEYAYTAVVAVICYLCLEGLR